MTRCVIFSDLHAHNFKFGARRVERDGAFYNSRLLDAVDAIDEIRDYVARNHIKHVLFAGDLFHRRNLQNTDTFNAIAAALGRLAVHADILLIPGNHDQADRAGVIHSLQVLASERITVADTVSKYKVGHMYVCTVPYTHDLDQAKKDLARAAALVDARTPHVLLAHLGIQGARVGSDYVLVSDTDIGVGDIPRDKFNACFFGHFHEHQLLFENGWFVGATIQHNWGDAGGSRGFLDVTVTSDRVQVTQVQTRAPTFVVVPYAEDLPSCDTNFVRILLPEGVDAEVVRQRHPTATIVPAPASTADEPFELTETQLSPESALTAWVAKHPPLDSSPEVLRLGQELLQRARGSTV